jgi:hypothetical protein
VGRDQGFMRPQESKNPIFQATESEDLTLRCHCSFGQVPANLLGKHPIFHGFLLTTSSYYCI